MLSDWERRELDLLERTLAEDDPRLARRLGSRHVESTIAAMLFGLAIVVIVGGGFALVVLGNDIHLHRAWMSVLGAFLAASAPFVACAWASRRRGPRPWRRPWPRIGREPGDGSGYARRSES